MRSADVRSADVRPAVGRPGAWVPLARLGVAAAGFAVAVWAWYHATPGDALLGAVAFGLVVVAGGWLGVRLRAATAELTAAVAQARVEAADVLGSLSSGVVTVDAAGRLLYANAAAGALLGVDLAAALGRPVLELVGAAAPGLADALRRAAVEGVRTSRGEAAFRAAPAGAGAPPAGTLGVTTTVGTGPGGARTGTAVFSDITASRQLAEARTRAARLEAVAELAASLAHEIRNPLASIRSAVEQLARLAAAAERQPLGADDAGDARLLAALTVRESDRLSRLLGEFLDFSRARVTRRERVDVAAAARDAARLAAQHPDAAGVAVLVEAPGPAGAALVDGDAELLHRALFNLVLNAAQAAAAGRAGGPGGGPPGEPLGTVRVRVTAGADAAGLAGPAVRVRVADDGPGVAPELVGRLFEPFVTGRAGGSGLGLAVVQRAVEAHGGVVLVEAGGAGAGACFTCVLPRAGAAPVPSTPTSQAA